MARGACTFKQQDVTRALKATVAAGIEVQRIEIGKDGKIVILAGPPAEAPEKEAATPNEWDGAT